MIGAVATFVIIFVFLLIGLFVWILWEYQKEERETEERLQRGCVPLAWNRRGTPTIWRCPREQQEQQLQQQDGGEEGG